MRINDTCDTAYSEFFLAHTQHISTKLMVNGSYLRLKVIGPKCSPLVFTHYHLHHAREDGRGWFSSRHIPLADRVGRSNQIFS